MADEDSGLPEESQGKLEQTNAVPVQGVGPWTKLEELGTGRQIFENVDDLFEYGDDIILNSRRRYQIVIVVDNSDEADLLYPNQPNYWVIEKFPIDPSVLLEDPDRTMEVDCTPLYKKMVEWAEEGGRTGINPNGSVQVSTYQGVPVYLPDPTLDYSRPETQVGNTTGAATGVTVVTTTVVRPNTAGAVTTSETVPADVGLDAFGGTGSTVSRSDPLDAFGGAGSTVSRSDPLDAFGGAGSTVSRSDPLDAFGGAGDEAAAQSIIARRSTASVSSGSNPCLPNNPPASARTSGSGATPPRAEPYQDAILRQARASAAAPASTVPAPSAGGGRGNGAAELARRRADAAATATAPTTVTQAPSTPTSTNQSAAETSRLNSAPRPRPPNIYVYEPLTPGFDRYDFNTGKKVYTPDAGPSRSASSQPVVPQPTPRVSPIDGGIPVGTTTGGPSLLRQRREAAALSGGAG